MRTRTMILLGALLLVFAGVAQAQQEQSAPTTVPQAPSQSAAPSTTTPLSPVLGRVDFGFRAHDLSGDPARYNRFQDLRQGGYVDRFRFEKETETWFFHADAYNVGYRDQKFGGKYESIGKLKLSFDWDQIPLFISTDTRTLYKNEGNGKLTIDDTVQRTLQNGGATNTPAFQALLTQQLTGAQQYDMRNRRWVGDFNMVYTIARDVDAKFKIKSADRNGLNLMSFGFGTSPSLVPAVEFGVPTDDRTTDVKGSIEFANAKGLLSVGYNGSWFDNRIPLVQFDNPLRADDISGGASKGQAVLWPSNSAFSVNLNGSYKLAPRTRASAAISVGRWNQNEALAPPTVNTALVAPPLERASAEAKADILSMVYTVNSRPMESIWLNAKYRYYDYASKTPLFETQALIGDWSFNPATAAVEETEPPSVKRQTLDIDASWSPVTYLGFSAGVSREIGDRTYRIFEKTEETIYRVAFDTTSNQYVTLRAKYEHGSRTGSGFDPQLLVDVGEQPDTRHYDIANRDRDRVTVLLTVTPVSQFDFNVSVSDGKDNYADTGFGLRDNDNNAWNVGFDFVPVDTVSFGAYYGEEKYTALQYSRTANPINEATGDYTFLDPTRDWWTDQTDKVKTWTANLDFLRTIPKTDIRISYDLSDGNATYIYNLKPEQKVFTTVPLTQVAPVKNKLTDARFDVQYYVRPNIALGAAYWYEDYQASDFSLNGSTINQLNPANTTTGAFAATIYSGYLYRNYTSHTGFLRMTYLW